MTWQTKTDALAPHAGGVSLSRLSGLPEWLRSNLFPQADRGRLTWRHILAGVLFVAAGAAVSLTRTSGPGALNSTWIEDAGNFLQDGLNHSVATTFSTQMNGYYDVVPRAITAVAVAFPVAWAPGIMSAAAAAEYALFGLIVYIASGPFLRNPWLRLLVAVPAFVVPVGYTQVNNDLATVQFIALYGLFWLLLWRPATRAGQVCAPLIMLGTTLTSILPVFFAPLLAARLIADRSKTAIAVAVCWAAGLLAQWSVQLRGMSNRTSGLFTSPLWILGNYVTRAVPRAIFGELALGGPGTNYRGSPVPLIIPDAARTRRPDLGSVRYRCGGCCHRAREADRAALAARGHCACVQRRAVRRRDRRQLRHRAAQVRHRARAAPVYGDRCHAAAARPDSGRVLGRRGRRFAKW